MTPNLALSHFINFIGMSTRLVLRRIAPGLALGRVKNNSKLDKNLCWNVLCVALPLHYQSWNCCCWLTSVCYLAYLPCSKNFGLLTSGSIHQSHNNPRRVSKKLNPEKLPLWAWHAGLLGNSAFWKNMLENASEMSPKSLAGGG